MEPQTHAIYWVHLRLSLALDPTKYIHLLLPTGMTDNPYEFSDPDLPGRVVGAGSDILLSDWISHSADRSIWGHSILRGCNVIVDDGARTTADLIRMVHSYCQRYNHTDNRVVLSSDAELHDWILYSSGRNVMTFLPDPRKPLTDRYLILKEMVTFDEPQA